MAGFDWGTFWGVVVGAGAALGGVLITQLFERKKAHDDRVWAKRAEIYVVVHDWATQQRDRVAPISTIGPEYDHEPTELRHLNKEAGAQLFIFGSTAVAEAYMTATGSFRSYLTALDKYRAALDDLPADPNDAESGAHLNHLSQAAKDSAKVADAALRELINRILAGTH